MLRAGLASCGGLWCGFMKHPCQAFVKNRKLRARIACGRSGRSCIVSGHSFHTRLTLCSRHRKSESRRYEVQKTSIEQQISRLREQCLIHRFLYYVRCLPVISDREYDLLENKLKCLVTKNPKAGKYADKCPTQTVGSEFAGDYPEEIQKEADAMISPSPVEKAADFLEGV